MSDQPLSPHGEPPAAAQPAELTRYRRVVIEHVGGHYGEEQWTTTAMAEAPDGDWVLFEDVKPLLAVAPAAALSPTKLEIDVADALTCFSRWEASAETALDANTISAMHDLMATWKKCRAITLSPKEKTHEVSAMSQVLRTPQSGQRVSENAQGVGSAALSPSEEPKLDQLLLDGMSTFENGCDFTLRFNGPRVFLSYGCYGVHVHLAQGARRGLVEWLGVDGTERELIGVKPETLLALKSRTPCHRCGGFTFAEASAPLSPAVQEKSHEAAPACQGDCVIREATCRPDCIGSMPRCHACEERKATVRVCDVCFHECARAYVSAHLEPLGSPQPPTEALAMLVRDMRRIIALTPAGRGISVSTVDQWVEWLDRVAPTRSPEVK